MTALERLALQLGACALLVLGVWLWHAHKVSGAYDAGYAAAVAAGEKQRAADAKVALTNERALRARLAAADAAAQAKEQTHAETLAAAQRRVRAGDDSLRCPAADPISASTAAADRSAADVTAPDQPGTPVVPEVAGDILGLAADTARLVRKYDELTVRYEACRTINHDITAGQ